MSRLALGALALLLAACKPEARIVVENARSPASPPGAEVAAVYLDVSSHEDDVLLAASTPVARRIEMHMTIVENDMMQMRPSPTVELPAGVTVRFAPGGLHFMLSGMRQPHAAGSSFPLRLTFQRAGEIDVQVRVHAPGEQ
jgi:periplasmic copper chaperone A